MPVLLDDATVLLIFKALTRVPPVSGNVIIGLLQEQGQALADQGKLIQTLTQKVDQMSQTQNQNDADFQTELAGIQADMTKQTTVTNSVLVFVQGIKQKLSDAIASAQAAGATAAELAAVQQLHAELNTNTQALVGATTENTTAATEQPAPVVPTTTVDATGDATADATGDAQAG